MRKDWVWMIKNALRLLGVLLHAPRGPFYSPKAARSRWEQNWKADLAFWRRVHRTVRCTPDTVRCPIYFHKQRSRPLLTVEDLGAVGAPDMSGAHRTVRCPLPTVGLATCRAQIPRPTVGPADRWLTGQSGAHQKVRWILAVHRRRIPESGLFAPSQPGAPDTVRCTTGQSGAPDRAESWLYTAKSFHLFFLFLTLRQVY
jgi:hypothetical protein